MTNVLVLRTGLVIGATLAVASGCGSARDSSAGHAEAPADESPSGGQDPPESTWGEEPGGAVRDLMRECFGEAYAGIRVEAPATILCPRAGDFAALGETDEVSASQLVGYFILDGVLATTSLWGDGSDDHIPLAEARSGMELVFTLEDGDHAEVTGLPGRGRWTAGGERTVDGVLVVQVDHDP